ncbi:single-stranded-DNA-specific exonuclease RecJ [Prochlorococcus sp. MIT 0916]|uniref:single-stranded-DNA-specific exonuclease RecJ n=1 Tax=Prochlorococcus sp. MIT 0916 TaxID=3082521 RepID=UPI0039B4D510
MTSNNIKRWILPKPITDDELENCPLNYILQKILIRRGLDINNELDEFIKPSLLPNPETHFNELNKATKRIVKACIGKEQIAICGDYDADGITSTVLLVEIFTKLGARVKPYIPSRKDDGYGLNLNMINEINNNKIKLVITVDNGISAFEAIKRSKELGIDLIITDHHKIPNQKSDYYSLIHPENTPLKSPYRYLAGVGIAYLLAKNICEKLNYDINKSTANVLFCIGTVADMAPLKGANRTWLKQFLPTINSTNNKGIKSIIKKLSIDKREITSEDIGYKIAPLINAIGRIGDPKLIIDLLTNENSSSIVKLTKECFIMNSNRKKITELIVQEALEIAYSQYQNDRKFLFLAKREWHPGIIGIVAARMVDKFNLPTAILASANDGKFRGSIRSNNKLMVNSALDECTDLLIAHGGHSAAAGFSINEENISKLMERLNNIAKRQFKNIDLSKSIKPDAHISFKDITLDFYRQLMLIAPFGIMNPAPIFWTRKCKIDDIYKLKGGHIKFKLNDGYSTIDAIKWNAQSKLKINDLIDIAYYIEINRWKNNEKIQLNLVDIKNYNKIVDLELHNRIYKCELNDHCEVMITNTNGQILCPDLSVCQETLNKKQVVFAKKILSFAEIALGKAA